MVAESDEAVDKLVLVVENLNALTDLTNADINANPAAVIKDLARECKTIARQANREARLTSGRTEDTYTGPPDTELEVLMADNVAAGELIESAWGNQVVSELTGHQSQLNAHQFTINDHTARLPQIQAGVGDHHHRRRRRRRLLPADTRRPVAPRSR